MSAPPAQRANILLVHCHDLGRFVGCYGFSTVHTPALDHLAAQSVVFDRAFATAPQCSPARASLFTGRYPHATGVMGLTQPPFDWDLNTGEQHLAALLGATGYSTELVGVHHESRTGPDEDVARRLGFDRVTRRGQRGADVTDLAVAALDRLSGDDRPFYLQVGYLEPHRLVNRSVPEDGYRGFIGDYIESDDSRGVRIPAYLRDEPSARVELAELQGAIRYVDGQIGRLLDHLDKSPAVGNTVVVFTTDHGLALPRAKCSLYDPGLETSLIVRGSWASGVRSDDLISGVDLTPTLLELTRTPAPVNLQGRSFLGRLRGETGPVRERLFAELTYHLYYDPRRCVRTTTHKLIANFSVAPFFMDSTDSWCRRTRPVQPLPAFHPALELYDLATDPGEIRNLADDHEQAATRDELVATLRRWMADTDDPLLDGAVTPPLHTANPVLSAPGEGGRAEWP